MTKLMEQKMAIDSLFDEKKHIIKYSVLGDILFHEILDSVEEIHKKQSYNPAMGVLWDLTKATFLNITAEEVRKWAILVGEKWGDNPTCKAALVAERTYDFGMARLYAICLENTSTCQVEVFRREDKALEWLGADQEYLDVDYGK